MKQMIMMMKRKWKWKTNLHLHKHSSNHNHNDKEIHKKEKLIKRLMKMIVLMMTPRATRTIFRVKMTIATIMTLAGTPYHIPLRVWRQADQQDEPSNYPVRYGKDIDRLAILCRIVTGSQNIITKWRDKSRELHAMYEQSDA